MFGAVFGAVTGAASQRRAFVAAGVGLAATAWVVLALWDASPWSRYLDQLQKEFDARLDSRWTETVRGMVHLLHSGSAIYQMMQVTGEEGITLDDFVTWQKATFLDMVYLQQDAFDPVDVSVPTQRQKESFLLINRLLERPYRFADKNQVREFFTTLTGLYKNLNYSATDSPQYADYRGQIDKLLAAAGGAPPAEGPESHAPQTVTEAAK